MNSGISSDPRAGRLRVAVVVPFLDEERHLGRLLDSLERQTRPADRIVLVDDGSRDRSGELAAAFAGRHRHVKLLTRPRRQQERDRLATAAELLAFQSGLEQVDLDWDVVVKLDGDIELTPRTLEAVVGALEADPRLGMAGAYLSAARPDGSMAREYCPPDHVRGPTKFYRRACYEQIAPLPAHLGWDTLDELRARMHGWHTRSVAVPGGDPVHLRPVGSQDGRLRAFRRWGECAWGYGEHPLHVLLVGVQRLRERPWLLGGASYVLGWARAGLRGSPRAEPELRAYVHEDQLRRIRRRALRGGRRSEARRP